jgi:predicted dehydrogenase
MDKHKVAIVGLGSRAATFIRPLLTRYANRYSIVGICDVNSGRMETYNRESGTSIPMFADVDAMLDQTAADILIVTSKDSTHHAFIVNGLFRGIRVITEKPMTIDAEKCRAILAAEAHAPHALRVCFNYRYAPHSSRIKELLLGGAIGRIVSADFNYYLDTHHGADYFRRWHRRKEYSGGLAVHKATHHFDLLNWWLDQDPVSVFATGSLAFYGPTRPERGQRCRTCEFTRTCEFHLDISGDEGLSSLYLDNEGLDGYFRDQCVFDPDIDIEDNIVASITYSGGTRVSYSLLAFAAYEGFRVAFNGTRGRLEAFIPDTAPWTDTIEIWITPQRGQREVIALRDKGGGHWGADDVMLDDLFIGGRADPLMRVAGSHSGAMSILTGVACNRSMQSGQPVKIADLLAEDSAGDHHRRSAF